MGRIWASLGRPRLDRAKASERSVTTIEGPRAGNMLAGGAWQSQEAKAHFSELLTRAEEQGAPRRTISSSSAPGSRSRWIAPPRCSAG
jgi:hypothetical protein